jgi:hypothetical protein
MRYNKNNYSGPAYVEYFFTWSYNDKSFLQVVNSSGEILCMVDIFADILSDTIDALCQEFNVVSVTDCSYGVTIDSMEESME